MTITPLHYSGNKNLKKIHQIVTSTKITILAKYMIRTIIDLAIAKKKQLDKHYAIKSKANEQYFNCRKKGHYAKNCYLFNKKKPKELAEKAKHI